MNKLIIFVFLIISFNSFSQECEKTPIEIYLNQEELPEELDTLARDGDLKDLTVCQSDEEIIIESDKPVPTRHLIQLGGYLGMFFGAEVAYGQLKPSGIPSFRASFGQEASLGANALKIKYEYYPLKKFPLYTGANSRLMTLGNGTKTVTLGAQVGVATTKYWINPTLEIGYSYHKALTKEPSFNGFSPDISLGIRVNLYRTKK